MQATDSKTQADASQDDSYAKAKELWKIFEEERKRDIKIYPEKPATSKKPARLEHNCEYFFPKSCYNFSGYLFASIKKENQYQKTRHDNLIALFTVFFQRNQEVIIKNDLEAYRLLRDYKDFILHLCSVHFFESHGFLKIYSKALLKIIFTDTKFIKNKELDDYFLIDDLENYLIEKEDQCFYSKKDFWKKLWKIVKTLPNYCIDKKEWLSRLYEKWYEAVEDLSCINSRENTEELSVIKKNNLMLILPSAKKESPLFQDETFYFGPYNGFQKFDRIIKTKSLEKQNNQKKLLTNSTIEKGN